MGNKSKPWTPKPSPHQPSIDFLTHMLAQYQALYSVTYYMTNLGVEGWTAKHIENEHMVAALPIILAALKGHRIAP